MQPADGGKQPIHLWRLWVTTVTSLARYAPRCNSGTCALGMTNSRLIGCKACTFLVRGFDDTDGNLLFQITNRTIQRWSEKVCSHQRPRHAWRSPPYPNPRQLLSGPLVTPTTFLGPMTSSSDLPESMCQWQQCWDVFFSFSSLALTWQ